MLQAALYVALGCAAYSAVLGNRAAWALLPLVSACLIADALGVVFRREYWLGMDAAAMVLIVGLKHRLHRPDWIILLLFPAAWMIYLAPDPYRYFGSVSVTALQLFLTFPLGKAGQLTRRIVDRWKANFQHRDEWTDLRARGADG